MYRKYITNKYFLVLWLNQLRKMSENLFLKFVPVRKILRNLILEFWNKTAKTNSTKMSSARIFAANISSIKVLHTLFIPVSKNKFNSIMVAKIYIDYGTIYISFTQIISLFNHYLTKIYLKQSVALYFPQTNWY